jgi:hypothetical protein
MGTGWSKASCGAAAVLLAVVALIGCGDQGASDAEVQQARKEAAQQARQQEQIKNLEKQIAETDKGDSSDSTNGGSVTPAPEGGASGPSFTSCNDHVGVGSSNTTCGFAENVYEAYASSGGSSTVVASSATTGQTYSMSCSGSSPVVCRGGNNAVVVIP